MKNYLIFKYSLKLALIVIGLLMQCIIFISKRLKGPREPKRPNSSMEWSKETKGSNGELLNLFGLMPFSLVGLPSITTHTMLLVEPATIYLILIPLIGVLVILFTNSDKVKGLTSITFSIVKKNSVIDPTNKPVAALNSGDTVLYNIALFFSLLNLLVSVIM